MDAGKKTAGEYGGNALIKAGDMIENSGRSLGTGEFDLLFLFLSFSKTHGRTPVLTRWQTLTVSVNQA